MWDFLKRLKEIHYRWIGIFVLGFIACFLVKEDHGHSFWENLYISWLFTAYFWNGAFLIFIYFRRKFPKIKDTPKRLVFTIAILIVFMTLGGIVPKLLININYIRSIFTFGFYFDYAYINFPAAFLVGSIYEAVYFFDNWKDTIVQNESLKNQQIRTQFEVLQNQMSPHFLFNSLNTLTALIAENQETAIDFTQRLSDVYRYILQNKEKELVPLIEELRFVKDYIFLLQMRYPENLNVSYEIETSSESSFIAPLTLQMLVENAIKHNIIAPGQPLNIKLHTEQSYIYVSNNLQRKNALPKSTKTGIQNIIKRYEYLNDKQIVIQDGPADFTIAIPLIHLVKEKSNSNNQTVYESIDHRG